MIYDAKEIFGKMKYKIVPYKKLMKKRKSRSYRLGYQNNLSELILDRPYQDGYKLAGWALGYSANVIFAHTIYTLHHYEKNKCDFFELIHNNYKAFLTKEDMMDILKQLAFECGAYKENSSVFILEYAYAQFMFESFGVKR